MMAGVVPKRSTSGRKQWTLHDGPRSSLKRLRSQMATDGCPESQVVLAKQLLAESAGMDSDTRENERLGVYWLIKASEQGNVEATTLLKACLKNGKGITELNYLDVKSCITMAQHEKLARKAAKELFASLSNGGEYITSDQLQKKMLSIEREHEKPAGDPHDNGFVNGELVCNDLDSDDNDTDWSLRSESSNEKLTEDNLITAAIDYSHGLLPLAANHCMSLSEPNLRALDHIPLIHRSILHPVLALKILYFKLIRFLSCCHFTLFFPLAKSDTQLVMLVFAYMVISSHNVLLFIPMLAYYLSFLTMILATFKSLQIKREFQEFRLWSGLFICYSGGNLSPEEAELQYIRNNLKPYGLFFGALLVNLFVYPIIVEEWIPQSELMIIAFCLVFATLLGYLQKKRGKTIFDFLVLFSFGINVLAKYPYETDPVVAQGWRFLDLKIPTFASYVIGNGIEFCINFRLLLYLCIPILLVKIAARQSWAGTYQVLIPHCVTLSWLQICVISAEGATMYGLLRGSLALVGVVLFLPLVGLTSTVLPALALTKWLITSSFLLRVGLFVAIALLTYAICWGLAQSRFKKLSAFLQILCTCLSVFIMLKSAYNEKGFFYNDNGKLPEFISWDVYQRFCYQPVWPEENVALSQLKCAKLENVPVHWDGYINDIKLKSISNRYRTVFDYFPVNIRQVLYALYGEQTENDCHSFPEIVQEDCESFYNAAKSSSLSSLDKHNVYTFELSVRMQAGIWGKSPQVTVLADHCFTNISLSLRPNDHIWFKGSLYSNVNDGADGMLGGYNTHVRLSEIGCLACGNNKIANVKIETVHFNIFTLIDSLLFSCRFLLNILLRPVIVFK